MKKDKEFVVFIQYQKPGVGLAARIACTTPSFAAAMKTVQLAVKAPEASYIFKDSDHFIVVKQCEKGVAVLGVSEVLGEIPSTYPAVYLITYFGSSWHEYWIDKSLQKALTIEADEELSAKTKAATIFISEYFSDKQTKATPALYQSISLVEAGHAGGFDLLRAWEGKSYDQSDMKGLYLGTWGGHKI